MLMRVHYSIRAIAHPLGRAPSTISRELTHHSVRPRRSGLGKILTVGRERSRIQAIQNETRLRVNPSRVNHVIGNQR
ncbi:Helix-turn-helix domain-containing protein [Vreelandella arcis]|uniref:Helix-turn-helix domain-containing protein n=1 Tax=Vreelandella arcis TaxID=416873 RepID=A0A1H0CEQ6_9GAMM|nr:Helix-turn-helix domain-containing protein [Halomonas arcis]